MTTRDCRHRVRSLKGVVTGAAWMTVVAGGLREVTQIRQGLDVFHGCESVKK